MHVNQNFGNVTMLSNVACYAKKELLNKNAYYSPHWSNQLHGDDLLYIRWWTKTSAMHVNKNFENVTMLSNVAHHVKIKLLPLFGRFSIAKNFNSNLI